MFLRVSLASFVVFSSLAAPASAAGTFQRAESNLTSTTEVAEPPGEIVVNRRPTIKGTVRYGKTISRTPGQYSVPNVQIQTTWLRNGVRIKGANRSHYKIRTADVGKKLSVRLLVSKSDHRSIIVRTNPRRAKHVRDVRHTVSYTVVTKGSISTSVDTFKRQVAETLNDPRGWRADGIKFNRVASGGSMTVVLAQASTVPSYSSACSSTWSCRVGRYVIINQERWKHASPAWNAAKNSTKRGYRHMVVNHEVGHWLGWGHSGCSAAGALAPVMMQQSKGLGGCKFNSWPKKSERNVPRFR